MSRLSLFPWIAWRAADHWSTESLARSRRNALTANTALAARRAERDEVAAYVAARESELHGDHPTDHHTDHRGDHHSDHHTDHHGDLRGAAGDLHVPEQRRELG